MQYHDIDKLYKFKAIDDNLINALKLSKIYAPRIEKLNDPFESVIYIPKIDGRTIKTQNFFNNLLDIDIVKKNLIPGRKITIDDLANMIYEAKSFSNTKVFKQNRSDILDLYHRIVAQYGIISFSLDNSSLLLWSHYALGHTGICMEFQRNADNELGRDYISFPVRYSSVINDIELLESSDRMIPEFFKYKADVWSYEKEWRYISSFGNQTIEFPGKLTSISFGINTSLKNKHTIVDIFGDTIRYHQAVKKQNEYLIEYEVFKY